MAVKQSTAEQKATKREYDHARRLTLASEGRPRVKKPRTPEENAQRRAEYAANSELRRRTREQSREWRAKLAAEGRKVVKKQPTPEQRERKNARKRAQELTPEQKQKSRERCLANYYERRDERRAKARDWKKAHSEEMRIYQNKRYAANPDVYKAYFHTRRARKHGAPGRYTATDVASLFAAQRGLCVGCAVALITKGRGKYHVDHIMPLILGGSNWPENLQLLCPSCNSTKHKKHPDEWARERGLLFA